MFNSGITGVILLKHRVLVHQGRVSTDKRSCREIARQSAVLYRLLTQTIEAPKKRTVKSDKHIKRKSGKGR